MWSKVNTNLNVVMLIAEVVAQMHDSIQAVPKCRKCTKIEKNPAFNPTRRIILSFGVQHIFNGSFNGDDATLSAS